MTTILTGWPPEEPILDLPPDDYEAAPTGPEDDRDDPLAELVDGPVVLSVDMGGARVTMGRYGLVGLVGAMLGA